MDELICLLRRALVRLLKPDYMTALSTLALAVLACFAWLAARDQLSAIQAEQRPWIPAPSIKFDDLEDMKKGSGRVRFEIDNVGHSPTTGTIVRYGLVPGSGWEIPLAEVCRKGREEIEQRGWEQKFSVVPNGHYISRLSYQSNTDITKIDTPHIVGCVSYNWAADFAVHQTGFVAEIIFSNGKVMAPEVFSVGPN